MYGGNLIGGSIEIKEENVGEQEQKEDIDDLKRRALPLEKRSEMPSSTR